MYSAVDGLFLYDGRFILLISTWGVLYSFHEWDWYVIFFLFGFCYQVYNLIKMNYWMFLVFCSLKEIFFNWNSLHFECFVELTLKPFGSFVLFMGRILNTDSVSVIVKGPLRFFCFIYFYLFIILFNYFILFIYFIFLFSLFLAALHMWS